MFKPKIFIEVSKFLKIFSVNPVIDALSECSCSTLWRFKRVLLTTLSQEWHKNLISLAIYNKWLDGLNLIAIANESNDDNNCNI